MANMQAPSLRVASQRQTIVVALLVALAMLLGGGGSPNPSTELILQLAAIGAVSAYWWLGRGQQYPGGAGEIIAIALGIFAIPIAQLIPLPPSIWHELPDRSREVAALSLIGAQQEWMPLSIAPARTLASLVAIVPALFLAWMVAQCGTRARG